MKTPLLVLLRAEGTTGMNIAMVSTHDCKGGAARSAFRLHQGLTQIGCTTRLYCRWKHSTLPSVVGLYDDSSLWKRWSVSAKSFMQRLPVKGYTLGKHCDQFSVPTGPSRKLPSGLIGADIVNLHWVSSMIDLPSFFASIPHDTKMVWTLHDMNAFTGGCHYSGPCDRYGSVCRRCPELHSNRDDDLSEQNFRQKQAIFQNIPQSQLTIVTPSRWLQECAEENSLLGRFRVERIPYGIDTDVFQPRDRIQARARIGLSPDSCVLLVVADQLDNHRKGLDLLLGALHRQCLTKPVCLLAMGHGCHGLEQRLPSHVTLIPMGFLDNEDSIAEAYSAADAFIIPSRQDNLPNTILESLACGTPVVGFRIGGIPDLVTDGVTGFCAIPEDPESLASAIDNVILASGAMRDPCRNRILGDFTSSAQAKRYRDLFNELTDEGRPDRRNRIETKTTREHRIG